MVLCGLSVCFLCLRPYCWLGAGSCSSTWIKRFQPSDVLTEWFLNVGLGGLQNLILLPCPLVFGRVQGALPNFPPTLIAAISYELFIHIGLLKIFCFNSYIKRIYAMTVDSKVHNSNPVSFYFFNWINILWLPGILTCDFGFYICILI